MKKLNLVLGTNEAIGEHDIYLNDDGLFYIEYTPEVATYFRNKIGKRTSPDCVYSSGANYVEVINRLGDWHIVE